MKLEELKALRDAALKTLTVEARVALSEWLTAESKAWDDGTYDMPSYTHPESGASHAIDALIEAIEAPG